MKHQLTGSEYPERRAACLDSARLMERQSLRDVTMDLVEENRQKMGELAYRRVRHVVTEIARCVFRSAFSPVEKYDKLMSILFLNTLLSPEPIQQLRLS